MITTGPPSSEASVPNSQERPTSPCAHRLRLLGQARQKSRKRGLPGAPFVTADRGRPSPHTVLARVNNECSRCICLRGEPAGAVITLLFRAGGWRGRAERQDTGGTRPAPRRRRGLPSARERRHAPRLAGSRPLRAARRSPRRDHRPQSPSPREAEACPPLQRGGGSQTTGEDGCGARHPHRVTRGRPHQVPAC